MGELGEMNGLETRMYDARAGKFRTTWVDSMGGSGTGLAWHNEKTNTWQIRSKMNTAFGKTTGKGEVQLVDANTMEWTWNEYVLGGLIKTMEMTGTSRRQ